MDGENHGKPYFLMDDLEGKPTIFGNIHIHNQIQKSASRDSERFPPLKLRSRVYGWFTAFLGHNIPVTTSDTNVGGTTRQFNWAYEKNSFYFPLNPGWPIGIHIMFFLIIPIQLGSCSSPIDLKQPVFFIAQLPIIHPSLLNIHK